MMIDEEMQYENSPSYVHMEAHLPFAGYAPGSGHHVVAGQMYAGDVDCCGNLPSDSCGIAKYRLCKAGGDCGWITRDCATVKAEVCNPVKQVFVSQSDEDKSIRTWANCTGGGGPPPPTQETNMLLYVGATAILVVGVLFATAGPQSKTITIARQ